MADQDPTDLHGLAVDAEQDMEKLATALGQAGAPPDTVAAVTKMADVLRRIIKALGAGQEQTADNAPPAPPAPAPQPHTLSSATSSLHQDMQASAAQRH